MRRRTLLMTAVAIGLFATIANAAGDKMTIAVFAKNLTNPAYEAFRIASDQIAHSTGAQVVHYVPKQPDNVDEQKAMVEQVLNTDRTPETFDYRHVATQRATIKTLVPDLFCPSDVKSPPRKIR
jgi:hypothetical protein